MKLSARIRRTIEIFEKHGVREDMKRCLLKTYKPTTPSRRHMTVSGFDGV